MRTKLFVALAMLAGCSIANAAQEMPQQTWWDAIMTYTYLSSGSPDKLEQRREKWADMSDDQKDAAIPQAVRQKWLQMSMRQRQSAAQDAWAWLRAH
jgi:hypothetical protein